MNTKLTLNLDKNVIESAKDYAKSRKVSLSQLIENYLNALTKKGVRDFSVSPLVESLTGLMPATTETDDRQQYYDYLEKKYS
jgi:hypothetical protein